MAKKAIIFDCFGVLVEDSITRFYSTYLSDKPDIVEQIKALDHLSTEGKISFDELLQRTSELSGVGLDEVKSFLELNPNNDELLNYIKTDLKPKYKIGFLSNAADDWLDELFSKENQALFDDFVLSYQHGIRKPDAKIFQLAAQRLGVGPAECVFVDDVIAYCDGARSLGMTAIQYESFEQLKQDLAAVL
ncbi:HAD-IA family hydrolase [Candidatus Saccharibacteria bacterium]|nr:HAD-IA family hydrolase [Candidatus Saccharibacteria bacterium]